MSRQAFVIFYLIFYLFPFMGFSKKPLQLTVTPLPRRNQGLFMPTTVLSAELLQKKQVTSLATALNQQPGITSSHFGVEGSTGSLKFRGANDAHTLVVIDGIPVNNPSVTSGFFNFGLFRNVDVEKVSLLPGSQSLLYGSTAVGGVVVIDTQTGKGPPKASLTQELGSPRLSRTQVKSSGQFGHVDFSFSGEKYRIGEGAIWNSIRQARQSDDFHDHAGSIKVGLQLASQLHCMVYMAGSSNEFKDNAYNFNLGIPIESNNLKTKNKSKFGYVRLNWKYSSKTHTLTTLSHLNTGVESFRSGLKSTASGNRSRFHQLINFQLNKQNLLQLAYEHETDSLCQEKQRLQRVSQNHVMGTYELKPYKAIILGTGLRYTHHQFFGSHLTYQLSGKVTFKSTTFFTSYGSGFKAPTLFQTMGSHTGLLTVLPNKSLSPEKSRSFDCGIEQTIAYIKSKLRAAYFILHIRDIIKFKLLNGGINSQYQNASKRQTHGFEGQFQTDFTKEIMSKLSYTYTRGYDSDTQQHPLKVPQHKLTLCLTYCPEKWQIFVEGLYVSSQKAYKQQRIGVYATLQMGVTYQAHKNLSLFSRLENVFDRTYEATCGYIARGRSLYGGVKVTF